MMDGNLLNVLVTYLAIPASIGLGILGGLCVVNAAKNDRQRKIMEPFIEEERQNRLRHERDVFFAAGGDPEEWKCIARNLDFRG